MEEALPRGRIPAPSGGRASRASAHSASPRLFGAGSFSTGAGKGRKRKGALENVPGLRRAKHALKSGEKKRKRSAERTASLEEEFDGDTAKDIPVLSPSRIAVGTVLLGVIEEVKAREAILVLPDNVRASLPLENVGRFYLRKRKEALGGENGAAMDGDMEDDSVASIQSLLKPCSMSDMFQGGAISSCICSEYNEGVRVRLLSALVIVKLAVCVSRNPFLVSASEVSWATFFLFLFFSFLFFLSHV